MFCWGSTIHGELGLGGIEDENILIPRELDFKKAAEIQQSKLKINNKIIHLYIYIFILLFIFLNNFSLQLHVVKIIQQLLLKLVKYIHVGIMTMDNLVMKKEEKDYVSKKYKLPNQIYIKLN